MDHDRRVREFGGETSGKECNITVSKHGPGQQRQEDNQQQLGDASGDMVAKKVGEDVIEVKRMLR